MEKEKKESLFFHRGSNGSRLSQEKEKEKGAQFAKFKAKKAERKKRPLIVFPGGKGVHAFVEEGGKTYS